MTTHAVERGTPRPDALLGFAIGQFFAIFSILGFARLSDRAGRRPVMLCGLAATAVLVHPMFSMLATGDFTVVTAAFTLYTLCHGATYGPMAAYIAEQFGTRTRYTGASLGYQLATVLGGGFTPVVLASLYASSGSSTVPVSGFIIALALLSGVVLLRTRETKDNDLTTTSPPTRRSG